MPMLVLMRQLPERKYLPGTVIWIRIGNCATHDVAALLRRYREDILRFVEQGDTTVCSLMAGPPAPLAGTHRALPVGCVFDPQAATR